ncbi:MAG: BREX system P-loop protein BrxC, partial [Methanomicrobium sp.]|nr:BREX system P-loop protein BrxC [Methanomicrobium sp.]
METKIENLFYNDIKREINGVIKVDQDDDENVYTELDEYVVTKESLKYIDTFFDRYQKALDTSTDKIGTWISGDFGSGKSHFLKIISYLLENRRAGNKTALEFFEHKISDPSILTTIEKSVNTGTKDVILFNIDSKSGETSERIVDILMRVFNEKRGYFGDVFWIAELEEDLEEKGLFDSFKEEFLKINGNRWEDTRDRYSFEQDDIVEALCKCDFQSREASERMLESDGQNYILTPEKFANAVKKYCKSKGSNHQVIFLIDEIGQYIGDNSHLMLNLQTVAEELGTILKGKAWIIVTSQADIETALKEIKGKETKQDFSKIQARFDTRVNLSSANVDEVIKKRILKKKTEYNETLSLFYEEKKVILKNLISFSQGSAEMKNYRDSEDFVSVYPFVPYQFNVLQKVFEKIRTTGFTGKHLAKGERSMLNAYKESAEKYGNSNVGTLVPFYSFYDTIESFLDPVIIRTITQAGENDNLDDFDCLILKTLFMIRHVKELQPSLDNIVVLSLENVDEDKLKLRESVIASLDRLEKETLISKSGDTFHFLTNEEQEINREIKNIDVERHKIIQEIYEKVFNSNDICLKSYGEYKFNKSVDDKLTTSPDADLTIRFLSELSDDYSRGSGQHSLEGANLSNIESKDTLLFVFPEDSLFIKQIESYLQIDTYLKQNSSNRNDELIQKVIMEKGQESSKLKDSSVLEICEGVKNSRIFIDGVEASIDFGTPKERVKEGYERLVKNVYSKSDYVTKDYESENDIIRLLKSDDLEKFGVGKSETNNLALNEMLNYISIKDEK